MLIITEFTSTPQLLGDEPCGGVGVHRPVANKRKPLPGGIRGDIHDEVVKCLRGTNRGLECGLKLENLKTGFSCSK